MDYNKKRITDIYRVKDGFRRNPYDNELIEEEEEMMPSFLRAPYNHRSDLTERNSSKHDKRLVEDHMHKYFEEELDEAKEEEAGEGEEWEEERPDVSEDTIDYITFRVLQNIKQYLENRADDFNHEIDPRGNRPRLKIEIGM